MNPALLMSLTAAKGLPMPIEEGTARDAIGDLLRKEKRVGRLVQRLRDRGETDAADALAGAPTSMHFSGTATGKGSQSMRRVEWTHAECAQACRGMDDRYFQAMRYTYALDDTSFEVLANRLFEWALAQREREDWPKVVVRGTEQQRYMRDLVDMWLVEVRQPWRFVGRPANEPELRRVIMDVSEPVWRRRLSPIYEAIAEEFVCWLSIGTSHMWRSLREEAA